MRRIAVGVHLRREDVEPVAEAVPLAALFLSAVAVSDELPLSDRDVLLRVAGVRAKLLDRATFIAVRYGFVFQTDAEAVARCAAHVEGWRALLSDHRHRVEMTLKVAASTSATRPDRHDFNAGADYLRALRAAKESVAVDADFRREVDELIVPLAIRHRWVTRDVSSVEMTALIDRAGVDDVSRAGEVLKQRCPEIPFLLSGPWPLEVFAEVDPERSEGSAEPPRGR